MRFRIKDQLLEIFFPTRAKCLGCGCDEGSDEPFLCAACRDLMTPSDVRAAHPEWKAHGLECALFVYYYGKPVKGLIGAFKFNGVWMLGDMMAEDMSKLLQKRCAGEYDLIVPVPLHPSRYYRRGYNQAEILAEKIAKRVGCEMRTDVLHRVRKTQQQSKLKREKRSANTKAAFRADSDLTGRRILVVDDVVTTGSTLCSCAEALRAAGAAEVRAIALAGSHSIHKITLKKFRRKR